MDNLSDVHVPNDVNEQSRIITTTTHAISNIEAQITRMRTDIDRLNTTLLATQRRFDTHISRTSQAALTSLCTTLHTQLPRELRDSIYAYLVTSPSQPIVLSASDLPVPIDYDGTMQPNHLFFQRQYVGAEAASEILEAYYSNNAFDICVDSGSYKAAKEWKWHHNRMTWNGMQYPLQKVKKLHIRLQCEDFEQLTCAAGDSFRGGRGERATIKYMRRLRKYLQPFCSLIDLPGESPKPEVELSLHTDFSYYCDPLVERDEEMELAVRKLWLLEEICFYHMLEAIRGDVVRLMKGGVKVTLTHRDKSRGGIHRYRERRDLTEFLQHMPVDVAEQEDMYRLQIPLWEVEADPVAAEIKLRTLLRERWRMYFALPWGLIDEADYNDFIKHMGVVEE